MGEQSRTVSLIEVGINILTGFVVAMLVWRYVIPEFFPRMVGPVSENFTITMIFTVTSIFRSYLWRRFFNNGFHATVVGWFTPAAEAPKEKYGSRTADILGHWVTPTGHCAKGCPECNNLSAATGIHYTGRTTGGAGCRCDPCLNTRFSIEQELGD